MKAWPSSSLMPNVATGLLEAILFANSRACGQGKPSNEAHGKLMQGLFES